MGKAAMCIQMLQVMNSGRIYKISELAEILDTNPRNIIEYKRELEEVGSYIISVPGKNGGYRLDKTQTIPSLKLTESEKLTVLAGASFLESKDDFLEKREFQSAISKIMSSMNHSVPMQDTFVIPGVTLSMSGEELLKRFRAAERCMKEKRALEIDFLSNDNVVRHRVIHPYKLFIFNNAWFVLGYCESAKEIRYYKLNRIVGFAETQKKFRVVLYYNERDYLDEHGLRMGGDWSESKESGDNEWVHIKLRFTGRPAMYVKEYLYGRNQVVTAVDKTSTILECDMHYQYNTVRFVLQFGCDCQVLEPKWLQDEVIKICKEKAASAEEN